MDESRSIDLVALARRRREATRWDLANAIGLDQTTVSFSQQFALFRADPLAFAAGLTPKLFARFKRWVEGD